MEEYNDQIEGRNAVLEYLESGKDINKILVATGEKHGSINKIIAIAKDRKIIITEIEKSIFPLPRDNNCSNCRCGNCYPVVRIYYS